MESGRSSGLLVDICTAEQVGIDRDGTVTGAQAYAFRRLCRCVVALQGAPRKIDLEVWYRMCHAVGRGHWPERMAISVAK